MGIGAMRTGFLGTFVISWAQTDIDGLPMAPVSDLRAGAAWCWRGDAVRIDGPQELLELDRSETDAELHNRAARVVRKIAGEAVFANCVLNRADLSTTPDDISVLLTDGARSFRATLIPFGTGAGPLLVFLDNLPPRDTDLWVVRAEVGGHVATRNADPSNRMICFTHGMLIDTPRGRRPVEDLVVGDYVLTKDDGPQPILWRGWRHMSGARLLSMPHLRPVRVRSGALGLRQPDKPLLVSPDHQLLVRNSRSLRLFNETEVLVAAKDLVDHQTVLIDQSVKEVTYIHLMFHRHQVLWANGVECESFHPEGTSLASLDAGQRSALYGSFPGLRDDPMAYGEFARRSLSTSEAAIMQHDAA